MLLNNTMNIFDPHPGMANSIAAGKRVTSSMSPIIVEQDGKPCFCIGLVGGTRIFPSALQAIVNVIDPRHGGPASRGSATGVDAREQLELERGFPADVLRGLAARGHEVRRSAGGWRRHRHDPVPRQPARRRVLLARRRFADWHRRRPGAASAALYGVSSAKEIAPMARQLSDADAVRALMRRLGEGAHGRGRAYFVGGASAVLIGWRTTTIDIDLKLAPEPAGVFDAIARAKATLNINVELAAPDDFIPALPDLASPQPLHRPPRQSRLLPLRLLRSSAGQDRNAATSRTYSTLQQCIAEH